MFATTPFPPSRLKGFLEITVEGIPKHFPKAEAAKQTQNRLAAGPYQPRQVTGHAPQISHAIQAGEIRKDAIAESLLFELADLLGG